MARRVQSRDTTPQPPASAGAATKITRSAAGVAANTAGQPAKRPGRPKNQQISEAAGEIEAGGADTSYDNVMFNNPDAGTSRDGRLRRPGGTAQHLEAVAEEANSFDILNDASAAAAAFHDAPETQTEALLRSPGGQSVLSGTTAVTSHSQSATRRLSSKKEHLFGELPSLHDQASVILRDLAQSRITLEKIQALADALKLPNDATPLASRLHNRIHEFEEAFDKFCEGDRFIQREFFLAAVLPIRPASIDDIQSGSWRPDDLLYKANLAMMSAKLMSELPGSHEHMIYLTSLDQRFPKSFLSAADPYLAEPGSTRLADQTFMAALNIRTQCALARLRSAADDEDIAIDPMSILVEVFCIPREAGRGDLYKGWDINFLQEADGTLPERYRDAVHTRVTHLLRFRREPGQGFEFDVVSALADFQWTPFLHNSAEWTATRNAELTSAISQAGGADQIVMQLEGVQPAQVTKNDDMGAAAAHELLKYVGGQVNGPQSSNIRSSLPQQVRSTNQFDYVNANGEPQEPPGGYDLGFGDGDAGHIQHQAPIVNMASRRGAQENTLGKQLRNVRLNEAQDGATRVPWDDTQSSQAAIMNQEGFLEAITQDNGFQQQVFRPDEAASRRDNAKGMKAKTGGKRGRPSKAAAAHVINSNNTYAPGVEDQEDDIQPPTKRSRIGKIQAARAVSPPEGEQAPATQYPAIQAAARRQGPVTQGDKKPTQKRTPWTLPEIQQLEWLITIYGISWSLLKTKDSERGNILVNRDQVALKDKARNMRADYESQQVALPENFIDIPLSKKEKDRVRGRLGPDWEPPTRATPLGEEQNEELDPME